MSNEKHDGSRIRPGPITLAALLLELLDQLYNDLADRAPEGPERDLVIIQWTRIRDEYKPLLERIIRRGR